VSEYAAANDAPQPVRILGGLVDIDPNLAQVLGLDARQF
jgi:hypothetical protein